MKVERKRHKQSQDMIERRFIHKKLEVICILAERMDWSPTLDQFRKGLTDEHHFKFEEVYDKHQVCIQEDR